MNVYKNYISKWVGKNRRTGLLIHISKMVFYIYLILGIRCCRFFFVTCNIIMTHCILIDFSVNQLVNGINISTYYKLLNTLRMHGYRKETVRRPHAPHIIQIHLFVLVASYIMETSLFYEQKFCLFQQKFLSFILFFFVSNNRKLCGLVHFF